MAPPIEVDVIIVGGGAAGCVVAGRLAKAEPTLQIAIIEAGQNFLMYTRGSASDYDDWNTEGWAFEDLLPLARSVKFSLPTETNHLPGQDPKLHGNNGPLNVSYGGHSSEIGKQFIDAAKSCYDVPYTEDLQNFKLGHGITKWAKWISPTTGRRQDAAHGYVHPIVATQTNLHVLTERKTIRVIFDENNKAIGVEHCANPLATAPLNPEQPPTVGTISTMKARKLVVISSGAFGSPMVLERSGVGAKEHLKKLDIDVVVDLPGVGATYMDHQLTLATYKVDDDEDTLDDYLRGVPEVHMKVGPMWAKNGQGLVATNAIDAGMKCRPTEAEVVKMGPEFQKVWKDYFVNKTDKPVMFGGAVSSFLGDHSLLPPGKYMMMGSYLMYPKSTGSVHINSKDPFVAPDFDAGYLSDYADMAPQVWMYKVLREITRRMPTSRGEFAAIHPKFSETSPARCVSKSATDSVIGLEDLVYSTEDDKAIEQWLRENVGTTWHSMGTVPMKPRAEGGALDAKLNVYGTSNLKVADLSICPSNVGSNTYSVALTVGEKAAMIIAGELGITM
ncbi:alcohol oxidase, partial [Phenoliferia sp. Uapishka_3]